MFVMLMMCVAVVVFLSGFHMPTIMSVIVLTVAVFSDSFTTWLCLRNRRKEGNPVVAFLFKKLGFMGSTVLWWMVWVLIIWFRVLPAPENVQTAVAIAYWLVPANNLMVFIRSRKMIKAHC